VDDKRRSSSVPPVLDHKNYNESTVFHPENLLREARRQKNLEQKDIPEVCILDPDGDIVRHLCRTGAAVLVSHWACYHSEMYSFTIAGRTCGIIGCAVGASYAVLIAEQLLASGCKLLMSMTS
jgi:hypothetical protein